MILLSMKINMFEQVNGHHMTTHHNLISKCNSNHLKFKMKDYSCYVTVGWNWLLSE